MLPGPTRHLGLDLGATNLKWAVLEHADGRWTTLATGTGPTGAADGPDAVVGRLAETGAAAMAAWPGVATCGIGIPGRYDPVAGTTRFLANTPGDWDGRPVAAPVAAGLGVPVALINDARAFGLAELRLGAARGARTMVGLTLGTGIGGVVAVDGRVHLGADGSAGELGHQTIDPDGPVCGCGNRGCLEAFARADRIAEACGTRTAEDAVRRARAGDRRALDGLARIGGYLGIGIANVVVALAPEVVVIGGGVAAAGELLFAPIRAELHRRVAMTPVERVRLVAAELGPQAGAIGAAIHGAEARAVRPGGGPSGDAAGRG